MNRFGIDVSEHQGEINWEIVKDKISFAILRLGWIGNKENHTIDKYFERNYNECKRLGIPVGIYVFNYCNSVENVTNGALWTILQLQNKEIDLPVYIDMEDEETQKVKLHTVGKETLTEIVKKFNSIMEANGYWAGVYANRNWFDNYLNKDEIKSRYTTWIAHFGVEDTYYQGEYDMLQYSKIGKLDGISDNTVDFNLMYRDLKNEIKGQKENNTQPINYTILKSNEEIVKEVIDGLWGNGEDRKQRLESNGYNYKTIQSLVNKEMKKKEEENQIIHIVTGGENLSVIAKKYNTTWLKIYEKNKKIIGNNPNLIKVGQKLVIPS